MSENTGIQVSTHIVLMKWHDRESGNVRLVVDPIDSEEAEPLFFKVQWDTEREDGEDGLWYDRRDEKWWGDLDGDDAVDVLARRLLSLPSNPERP